MLQLIPQLIFRSNAREGILCAYLVEAFGQKRHFLQGQRGQQQAAIQKLQWITLFTGWVELYSGEYYTRTISRRSRMNGRGCKNNGSGGRTKRGLAQLIPQSIVCFGDGGCLHCAYLVEKSGREHHLLQGQRGKRTMGIQKNPTFHALHWVIRTLYTDAYCIRTCSRRHPPNGKCCKDRGAGSRTKRVLILLIQQIIAGLVLEAV